MEEYLLNTLPLDSVLLMLWQNEPCVVIGRNQSAENEVNIEALEKDGGYLVRRLSGGGAVYHDLQNLNFTFIVNNELYDLDKQTEVILQAVKKLSIDAERNGRNDITVLERKFSGNAYYHGRCSSYHHGTIMVEVDNEAMQKYLNVSMVKLASKQVKSVKSRVINLKELKPDITVPLLKEALKEAFREVYGEYRIINESDLDEEQIRKLTDKFVDPLWKYGHTKAYTYEWETRFSWGTVLFRYDKDEDVITDCAIYTDALNTEALNELAGKLKGLKISLLLKQKTWNEYERDVIGYLIKMEEEHAL